MSSLGEVNDLYNTEYKHYPETATQLYNFCSCNNYLYSYAQCRIWWEIRPAELVFTLKGRLNSYKYLFNTKPKIKQSTSITTETSFDIPDIDFLQILKHELTIPYKTILSKWKKIINDKQKYDTEIIQSINRYKLFIKQCKDKGEYQNIHSFISHSYPLHIDIQLLWRVHMLHPYEYKQNCIDYFGFKIYPLYDFINLLNYNTNDSDYDIKNDINISEFTQIDFKTCVFQEIKNIIKVMDSKKRCKKMEKSAFISRWYKDYKSYSSYDRQLKGWTLINIPSEIQFVWHTHLLFPQSYFYKRSKKKKSKDKMKKKQYKNIADNKYHHVCKDSEYSPKDIEMSEEFWGNKNKGEKYLMYIVDKCNHKIQNKYFIDGYFRELQHKCDMDDIIVPYDVVKLCLNFYNIDPKPPVKPKPRNVNDPWNRYRVRRRGRQPVRRPYYMSGSVRNHSLFSATETY
eukprot:410125_1